MGGRIWTLPLRIILITATLLGGLSSHAAATETNFNGHYELIDAKARRTFSLDVVQTESRARISFAAAMADGDGAAPDGTGKGRVEDGVLSFDFTDSFKNKGTCTLELIGGIYHLNIVVLKVVDPSPFHFYGTALLKKTSDKPESPAPPSAEHLPQ
jgi:hypothetical protein